MGVLKKNWQLVVIGGSAVLITVSWHARTAAVVSSSYEYPYLREAHNAFAQERYKDMALSIRRTLEANPQNEVVRLNALGLLERAYEARGGAPIPVDWELPQEIEKLKISVRHGYHMGPPVYDLSVIAQTKISGLIKQIRLVKFPNQVVLDREKEIGLTDDTFDAKHEVYMYTQKGGKSKKPVGEGLYTLLLELNNGQTVNGWFVLGRDMNSTATPLVHIPHMGQTFESKTPLFRFKNFKSPQYQGDEIRMRDLLVSRIDPPDYEFKEVWEDSELHPHREKAKVRTPLPNGRYVLYLQYRERKLFGDLNLDRTSYRVVPFRINAGARVAARKVAKPVVAPASVTK